MNLFKFIGPQNLTVAWKEQYEELVFGIQLQTDVDRVVLESQEQVFPALKSILQLLLLHPAGDRSKMRGNGCPHGKNPGLRLENTLTLASCAT